MSAELSFLDLSMFLKFAKKYLRVPSNNENFSCTVNGNSEVCFGFLQTGIILELRLNYNAEYYSKAYPSMQIFYVCFKENKIAENQTEWVVTMHICKSSFEFIFTDLQDLLKRSKSFIDHTLGAKEKRFINHEPYFSKVIEPLLYLKDIATLINFVNLSKSKCEISFNELNRALNIGKTSSGHYCYLHIYLGTDLKQMYELIDSFGSKTALAYTSSEDLFEKALPHLNF